MFATAALCVATPLYWASSAAADGATAPVGTMASKDPAAHGGGYVADDGPTGDDLDGTTAPGFTTTCVVGDTSTQNTTAPGVTTAPGETTQGDQQTSPGEPPPEQPQPEQPQPEQPEQPEQQPPPRPAVHPPAAQPPAAQPPRGGVLPQAPVTSPTARFRAGSSCPPQAFNARVTGRHIARVVFTLDGRRYATVNRPDANGVWKVRVDPRRLSRGKHRLVATASFEAAARSALRQAGKPARKVMTVTFTVCARSAQRPTFTG